MLLDTSECLLNYLNTFLQWWPHSFPKKTHASESVFSVAERLALTLRFLAAADAQQSLSFSYRLGKYTVSNIIRDTCEKIYQGLEKNYLNPSGTPEQWQKIADQFKENWNM